MKLILGISFTSPIVITLHDLTAVLCLHMQDRLRASLCVENAAIAKRKHDIEKSKSEEQQNAAFAEMHAAEIKVITSSACVTEKAILL